MNRALTLTKVLLLAVAYAVAGKLSLLLAVPPGYASAIFPPAGIALAASLIVGVRALPGIWLGSFLLNNWIGYESLGVVSLKSVTIAAIIGIGATLQAAAGKSLIDQFLGKEAVPFQTSRRAIAFLFLGGPISCLVNATIAVTCLWVAGITSFADYLFTWSTWWSGDAIGVIVLTPLLIFVTLPENIASAKQKLLIAVPPLLVFAAFIGFYHMTSRWEQKNVSDEFWQKARAIAHVTKTRLEANFTMGLAIQSFFLTSDTVNRDQFSTFTKPFFSAQTGIQAVEWSPRTLKADRETFETRARKAGLASFQINERDAHGKSVQAAARSEYFPVWFIEPLAGNESALGYDLASEKIRLSALVRARALRQPVLSGRIQLVQETGQQHGMILFLPVYGKPTEFLGYVSLVYRISSFAEEVLHGQDLTGINLKLIDEEAPAETRDLYTRTVGTPAKFVGFENILASIPIAVGVRKLCLEFRPTEKYILSHRSWRAWGFLVGGLLFVSIFSLFHLVTNIQGTSLRLYANELYHKAPCGYHSLDENGIVVRINETGLGWLGYTKDEVIGKHVSFILSPKGVEQFSKNFPLLKKQGELKDTDVELRSKDGKILPVAPTARAIKDSRGNFRGGQASYFDVSKRLEAQLALKKVTQDLATTNSELEQFVYISSHDLREPLRTIITYSQLLEQQFLEKLGGEGAMLIEVIVKAGSRMLTLIHDLLIFSKTANQPLEFEPLHTNSLVSAALENLQTSIQKEPGSISVDPLPDVLGMREPLTLLFQNLIANAIKFHGEAPSKVHIGAEERAGKIVFFVRDNGIGVDARYFDKIFEAFQRVHPNHLYPGSGIGLATCKKVVERHGGEIWVDSQLGSGTTFYFTLPLQKNAA